ncbi:Flagellar hook-length control protein FliK [Legionella quinlivanii]|uniref:Flagellar hook-length control protein FliK n=1 Tax=Legionella quinlivanii TaxID=45073 RepID=A0A0W0Y6I9_9GAMM|nr:flagellar hook-length control protein FliK [Legionella quinlivanii]KTD52551.1 Flagellar hook-length control protein FliK [Legionella quinlivanii]SEF70313.1 hook-length control protein FliK [Legionella quinlivanii DSM 21216]STY12099.1 Flagellar hook-length control protein FliK [Legionella quinlivanii]
MATELVIAQNLRLNPVSSEPRPGRSQELYIGQLLRAVVNFQNANEVSININGQNINAKTSHHFTPGELLEIKVAKTGESTVLQVIKDPVPLNTLNQALLHYLPRQLPATQLMPLLSLLQNQENLPESLRSQVQQLLQSIVPLNELPQKFQQALVHSGYFLEASLLNFNKQSQLGSDFKGQCLQLLAAIQKDFPNSGSVITVASDRSVQKENLPLPGVLPQPYARPSPIADLAIDELLPLVRDHLEHVLARITAGQLTHLLHTNPFPYSVMVDLPVNTSEQADIIPLLIKEEPEQNAQESNWSIRFAVNLEHLGAIQAKLTLQGDALDVQLNSEIASTLEILQENAEDFSELLKEAGLNLRSWHLRQGLEDNQLDTANLKLLDIKV